MIRAVIALAALVALVTDVGSSASVIDPQGASAPALRAAFMYNFAKFTEWPANVIPRDQPLVFCVTDDGPMAEALEQIVKGRAVGGHALAVRQVALDSGVRACHLLYASGLDAKRANELLGTVDHLPVLTVGDFERFAQMGGVASFFVEDGKMRFAINIDSAHRAGLRVSSKLLMLARIVRSSDDRTR
jgi:YfiR/HmsC-like